MGNPGCYFYHDGVCKVSIRISGMLHVEHLEEGLCSYCDALTEDEIDALCDNDIMGFTYVPACESCSSYCNRNKEYKFPLCGAFKEIPFWKWEPKTEGP